MKMRELSSVITGVALALAVSGSVFAAENTEGVKEHMALTVEKTKAAQDAASAGNKEECVKEIKQAKQHYKEITGDAAGKPLQDAVKLLKVAQDECEKGNTAKAATTLADVKSQLDKINAAVQAK